VLHRVAERTEAPLAEVGRLGFIASIKPRAKTRMCRQCSA